jgi:hypothetical protein
MRTPRITSFTKQAVQRAMDARAAKWGAPPGYYSVEDRALVLDPVRQIWRVRTRLYSGAVNHYEDVVFTKQGYDPTGQVIYQAIAASIMTPEIAERMFHYDARYPATSKQAYAKWRVRNQ